MPRLLHKHMPILYIVLKIDKRWIITLFLAKDKSDKIQGFFNFYSDRISRHLLVLCAFYAPRTIIL